MAQPYVLDKLVGLPIAAPAEARRASRLDGSDMDCSYTPEAMMSTRRTRNFLDELSTWNMRNFTTDYHDSELQLIPLIVASGNWWNPWECGRQTANARLPPIALVS